MLNKSIENGFLALFLILERKHPRGMHSVFHIEYHVSCKNLEIYQVKEVSLYSHFSETCIIIRCCNPRIIIRCCSLSGAFQHQMIWPFSLLIWWIGFSLALYWFYIDWFFNIEEAMRFSNTFSYCVYIFLYVFIY